MTVVRCIRCAVSRFYIKGVHAVAVCKVVQCNVITEIIPQLSKCLIETEITVRDPVSLSMIKSRCCGRQLRYATVTRQLVTVATSRPVAAFMVCLNQGGWGSGWKNLIASCGIAASRVGMGYGVPAKANSHSSKPLFYLAFQTKTAANCSFFPSRFVNVPGI